MRHSSLTDQKTDEELIALVSGGSVEAFEVLASKHHGRFRAIARSILRDHDDAADVVQNAMLKVFLRAHTFNGSGSFAGWSAQIVRNEALMWIRRRKRRSESPLDAIELRRQPDESLPSPDQRLQDERLRESLARAISYLAPKYRRPFELKMFEGLSVIEVAEIVGLSEGGAKTRLRRARAKLQESLMRNDAEVVEGILVGREVQLEA